MPGSVTAAESAARDPRRLSALCALWQTEEREVILTLRGGSMSPTILPGGPRMTVRPDTLTLDNPNQTVISPLTRDIPPRSASTIRA